jgi:anti-sigma B factor antagonist
MHSSILSSLDPPIVTITVSGDFDLSSAPQLRRHVAQALAASCSLVVVDLGEVTFIDCTGVSALLACLADIELAGAALALRELNPRVVRMLELTGTTSRLVAQPA